MIFSKLWMAVFFAMPLLAPPAFSQALGWKQAAPAVAEAALETEDEPHEQGRKIFNFYCYFCHGYSGDAKTQASLYLNPKPRDFTSTPPDSLSREQMINAVASGKKETAMKSFSSRLSARQIELVVDFVIDEFIVAKAPNTWYHTRENGWDNHEKYKAAFPFATGKIPFDKPERELSDEHRAGRKLFLEACIICHDGSHIKFKEFKWEKMEGLNSRERKGEALFQANCAFCHGRDGSGKNWIGAFLRPYPRNLREDERMEGVTSAVLREVIVNGLAGTSMPAWGSVFDKNQVSAIIAYISKAVHPVMDN